MHDPQIKGFVEPPGLTAKDLSAVQSQELEKSLTSQSYCQGNEGDTAVTQTSTWKEQQDLSLHPLPQIARGPYFTSYLKKGAKVCNTFNTLRDHLVSSLILKHYITKWFTGFAQLSYPRWYILGQMFDSY